MKIVKQRNVTAAQDTAIRQLTDDELAEIGGGFDVSIAGYGVSISPSGISTFGPGEGHKQLMNAINQGFVQGVTSK